MHLEACANWRASTVSVHIQACAHMHLHFGQRAVCTHRCMRGAPQCRAVLWVCAGQGHGGGHIVGSVPMATLPPAAYRSCECRCGDSRTWGRQDTGMLARPWDVRQGRQPRLGGGGVDIHGSVPAVPTHPLSDEDVKATNTSFHTRTNRIKQRPRKPPLSLGQHCREHPSVGTTPPPAPVSPAHTRGHQVGPQGPCTRV